MGKNPFDPLNLEDDGDELTSFAPDLPVPPEVPLDDLPPMPDPPPFPVQVGTSDVPAGATGQIVVPEEAHLAAPLGNAALIRERVPADLRIRFRPPEFPQGTPDNVKTRVIDALVDEALYGVDSKSMVCRGAGIKGPDDKWIDDPCPYLAKCPWFRHGLKFPLGSECPIEQFIMRTWTQAYMIEMGVNPHNAASAFDVSAARMLADMQLVMHRAMWGEAIDPRLEKYIEQIGPSGARFMVQVSNLNTKEKMEAMKAFERLGKTNMQSRREKAALTKSGYRDQSRHTAEVADRLRKMSRGGTVTAKESVEVEGPGGVSEKLERIRRFSPPPAPE